MTELGKCPLCGGNARKSSSFHQREDGIITSMPSYVCGKCGHIRAGATEKDFYNLRNGRDGFASKREIEALDNLARERWNEISRLILNNEERLTYCGEISLPPNENLVFALNDHCDMVIANRDKVSDAPSIEELRFQYGMSKG